MASSLIGTKFPSANRKTAIVCSLAPGGVGLVAGGARQSTMISNVSGIATDVGFPAAIVYLKIKSGGVAPTAGKVYSVYLLRGDDPSASSYRTDGAGASDASIAAIENAQLLGTIIVTATATKVFYGEFDTAPLGPLGPEWGIAIKNDTDQTVDTTEGNFLKEFSYYIPEAQ